MNYSGLFLRGLILTTLTVCCFSCYYESEEELYPERVSCDTLNVSFSGIINPIISNNCLTCHGSSVALEKGSGLDLEGYSNILSMQEAMLAAMKHESFAQPMPKDAPKLSDCNIRQFEIWIESGSPDN